MRRPTLSACSFIFVAMVTLFTTSPSVYWLDSGQLSTAAFHLGVAHAPGEPLWVMLGHLLDALPLGDVAFRANLLSCLAAAAVAPGLILAATTWGRWRWGRRGSVALLLTLLTPSLTYPLWMQAVRSEVYSLQLALVVACIAYLGIASRNRPRPWMVAAILGGLAASVHPLLAAAGILPAILIAAFTRGIPRGPALLATACCAGVGLTPFVLPALRSHAWYVWGDPGTWQGYVDLITAKDFGDNFSGVDIDNLKRTLGILSGSILQGPSTTVLGLSIVGLGLLLKTHTRLALLLVLSGGATFCTELMQTKVWAEHADIHGYLSLVHVGLWVAAGASLVALGAFNLPSSGRPLPSFIPVMAVLVFGAGATLAEAPHTNRAHNHLARIHARAGLDAVPPGGTLITSGNSTMFTVMYLQWVEGFRPDVRAAHRILLTHPWYRRTWSRPPRTMEDTELRACLLPPSTLATLGPDVVVDAREKDIEQANRLCPTGDPAFGYYRVVDVGGCTLPEARPTTPGLTRWRDDFLPDLDARQAWLYANSLLGDYYRRSGHPDWAIDPFATAPQRDD